MTLSKEDIKRHYSGCIDSMNIINAMFDGSQPSTDPLETVQKNQAHLLDMLSADFWSGEDLSGIREAAIRTTDSVTFPKYSPKIPPRRIGEFREFMQLFTDEEQLSIIGATLQNVNVKRWYDTAMGGATFSLDHPQTEYGLSVLVTAGLLTNKRKSDILKANFDA